MNDELYKILPKNKSKNSNVSRIASVNQIFIPEKLGKNTQN